MPPLTKNARRKTSHRYTSGADAALIPRQCAVNEFVLHRPAPLHLHLHFTAKRSSVRTNPASTARRLAPLGSGLLRSPVGCPLGGRGVFRFWPCGRGGFNVILRAAKPSASSRCLPPRTSKVGMVSSS